MYFQTLPHCSHLLVIGCASSLLSLSPFPPSLHCHYSSVMDSVASWGQSPTTAGSSWELLTSLALECCREQLWWWEGGWCVTEGGGWGEGEGQGGAVWGEWCECGWCVRGGCVLISCYIVLPTASGHQWWWDFWPNICNCGPHTDRRYGALLLAILRCSSRWSDMEWNDCIALGYLLIHSIIMVLINYVVSTIKLSNGKYYFLLVL